MSGAIGGNVRAMGIDDRRYFAVANKLPKSNPKPDCVSESADERLVSTMLLKFEQHWGGLRLVSW